MNSSWLVLTFLYLFPHFFTCRNVENFSYCSNLMLLCLGGVDFPPSPPLFFLYVSVEDCLAIFPPCLNKNLFAVGQWFFRFLYIFLLRWASHLSCVSAFSLCFRRDICIWKKKKIARVWTGIGVAVNTFLLRRWCLHRS